MTNPCLKCSVDQSCCRDLHGLTLSEEEYERLFKNTQNDLTITKKDRFYKVFSNGKGPCPHWDGQCTIYGDRPMDCDLYPYTLGNIFDDGKSVLATYHSRTECPLSDIIIQPRKDAEKLITDFLVKFYGSDMKITVRYDEGAARLYHLARRAMDKAKRLIKPNSNSH